LKDCPIEILKIIRILSVNFMRLYWDNKIRVVTEFSEYDLKMEICIRVIHTGDVWHIK
jgi:hypothetical protein